MRREDKLRGIGASEKMITFIYGTWQLIAVNTPAISSPWHSAGVRTEFPSHRLDQSLPPNTQLLCAIHTHVTTRIPLTPASNTKVLCPSETRTHRLLPGVTTIDIAKACGLSARL